MRVRISRPIIKTDKEAYFKVGVELEENCLETPHARAFDGKCIDLIEYVVSVRAVKDKKTVENVAWAPLEAKYLLINPYNPAYTVKTIIQAIAEDDAFSEEEKQYFSRELEDLVPFYEATHEIEPYRHIPFKNFSTPLDFLVKEIYRLPHKICLASVKREFSVDIYLLNTRIVRTKTLEEKSKKKEEIKREELKRYHMKDDYWKDKDIAVLHVSVADYEYKVPFDFTADESDKLVSKFKLITEEEVKRILIGAVKNDISSIYWSLQKELLGGDNEWYVPRLTNVPEILHLSEHAIELIKTKP